MARTFQLTAITTLIGGLAALSAGCPLFLERSAKCGLAYSYQHRPQLRTSQRTVQPGQRMRVWFRVPAGYARNAWLGVIPSHIPHGSETVNDRHDLTYQYLQGRRSGWLIFQAPWRPGRYDFRLHESDNRGREVASVTFTVHAPAWYLALERRRPRLCLGQRVLRPGQRFNVSFVAKPSYHSSAWVGIVPGWVPHGSEWRNDRYDISYRYLRHRAHGTFTFRAPWRPGRYDLRMHDTDSNGREVAFVSFVVARPTSYIYSRPPGCSRLPHRPAVKIVVR